MKIYIGWHEGFMCSDYIGFVSTNKLALVKKHLEEKKDQNVIIKVFNLETMDEEFECNCMVQHTIHQECNCLECKPGDDEVVQYLKETKQGNWKF